MLLNTHRTIQAKTSNFVGTKVARWAWFIYATFVVYGSLVPFDFHPLPFDQAWVAFQKVPFLQLGVESRADWIANGVLYFPLGFLGVRALTCSEARLLPALASLIVAGLLAFTIEFAQLSFPPRTVSQNDLLAEILGSLAGVGAAQFLGGWQFRWWHAWRTDAASVARLALQAYILGYLLFCFFPFDFLVSRQELVNKVGSGNLGWLFALPESSLTAWLRTLLQLLAEVVLTIPFGFAIGSGHAPQQALRRGVVGGAILGLTIEIGQIFIASGVSQGASLFSRAVGTGLGAWLGTGLKKGSLDILRNWLSRYFGQFLMFYIALLGFASGWVSHPWQGWEQASRSWGELHFLPFYYHYFTTEAAALTSLGSVVVIYAPLAILAWANMASAGAAATLAATVALVMEAGKLFLVGIHPDPTNVLLAGVSVGLLTKGLAIWERQRRQLERLVDLPTEDNQTVCSGVEASAGSESTPKIDIRIPAQPWLIVLLIAIAWVSIGWPDYFWLVFAVVAAAAAATWWRPAALLVILPAAMPVFDFAPWSGRFFLDEFDLLCAACLAVGFARERPQVFRKRLSGRALAFFAMVVSLLIGALVSCGGNFSFDMNSFSNYHSPFNGMRIFKGAFWAWLFVTMYRSLVGRQPAVGRLLHVGFASGLALTVLVVLWERLAMVAIFDFTTDYRVTGPFSVMNKGGAYIECFLAVGCAFIIIELASCRQRLLFWAVSTLLVLAAYAMLVTYSRNGFAALAVTFFFGIFIAWRSLRRSPGAMLPTLLTMGVITIVGGFALSGGFARERLDNTAHDLDIRLAHWRAALDLRDDGLVSTLLGEGLGRFPEKHFWQSRTEQRAAAYRVEPGDGNAFLRLAPGAPIYIEQIISPPVGQALELSINLRSAGAPPKLAVTLCRKTLLTADECEQVELTGIKAPGYWQNQYATLPPLPEPANLLAALVPVKISLVTPASGQVIDVDNASLRLPGSADYLTRNGSFARGMDNWFFATDVDPPWHIHSLPVALLFDLGWLGLAAALALLSVAVVGGVRALRCHQIEGMAAFVALLAFLVSGSLNTLIDEPRFLWLWLVLAWVCGWQGKRAKRGSLPVV